MRYGGRIVLLGCLLPIVGCGLVDSIKSPKYGVYVDTKLTQGDRGKRLKPERFAYITEVNERGNPAFYALRILPESPTIPSGLESSQYIILFNEVPPGTHKLKASISLVVTQVERTERRVGGVVRLFETREDLELFPESIPLSVTLEPGHVYEVALAGGTRSRLALEVRKLNPDNFEFTSKYNYVVDKRKARNFEPRDSDVAEVITEKVLCAPCVTGRR